MDTQPHTPSPKYYYLHLFLHAMTAACLLTYFCFALFYLLSGYSTLVSWFFSLNGCFYKHDSWTTNFFTPAVKNEGNPFAIATAFLCIAGLIYLRYRWKQYKTAPRMQAAATINSQPVWYAAVCLIAFGLWIWGSRLVSYSYDEIFSGINCSSLPHFQTIAYYMLPNNHMYFNVLNSFLFGWLKDPVISGRMLSGIAYAIFLCVAFTWLTSAIGSKGKALLALLPLALQFTSWGFSFQGRGYESELCCSWIAFVTIFAYARTGSIRSLRINSLACIIGFTMLPTFTYYYVPQLLFITLLQAYHKKPDFQFLKHQLIIGAIAFLCYTPGICFSGMHAFTGNDFVKSLAKDTTTYLPTFIDVSKYFINFCFSFLFEENNPLNFILFFLPFLLLFMPRREQKMLGIFYLLMWLSYTGILLYMRRAPFNRNMIVNYSITMACVIYTAYSIVELLISKLKNTRLKQATFGIAFLLPVLAYTGYLLHDDAKTVAFNLYFYDLNKVHASFEQDIPAIPKGSSIGFSDEAFYWRYYCHKMHYPVTPCPSGTEDYFVKRPTEQLPPELSAHYTLFKTCQEQFEIYKRN